MKLVIALDMSTPDENFELVRSVSEAVAPVDFGLKVGLNTFCTGGFAFIEKLKAVSPDFEIILDLKLYDIPNTMAETAARIAESGLVDLMTIHASSGEQAMKQVMSALGEDENRPKVLAVTILTSFTHDHCVQVYNRGRSDATSELIQQARNAHVDGIVCSAHDLKLLASPKLVPIIKFVPGIELKPREDDQQRKGTLKDVVLGGADYIVVGRQIYQSEKPAAAANIICGKIDAMMAAMTTLDNTSKWSEHNDQQIENWTNNP